MICLDSVIEQEAEIINRQVNTDHQVSIPGVTWNWHFFKNRPLYVLSLPFLRKLSTKYYLSKGLKILISW